MCGIVGLWGNPGEDAREVVSRMSRELELRGPDSNGVWADPNAELVFGHQRLAILDLSEHGHQPMVSRSGRWVVTFNGEVYNYDELRAELDGPWRGHSDTEVLLECFEAWGVQGALERFSGMFALGVWDRQERTLTLARDRLGIKPLYYAKIGGCWAFASTLSALTKVPGFTREVDSDVLTAYLRHGCVPGTRGIYAGVKKLAPGTLLTLADREQAARPERFWSALDAARAPRDYPDDASFLAELEETLGRAVSRRMISDVPLGAFLSGGVDSSAVVALMCERSTSPVKTFSIGFDDAAYDESSHARAVAEHLGTDHHELIVSPKQILDTIPRLADVYDEPFADSSQLPTLIVSELAREQVTVALSGDGGDELFAGYNRHVWLPRIWRVAERVPRPARLAIAHALRSLSSYTWDAIFEATAPLRAGRFDVRLPGDKLHKIARVLPARDLSHAYATLVSIWEEPERLVRKESRALEDTWANRRVGGTGALASRLALLDLLGYMPDDILTKVDRASMASSLEARVPLLDHEVVELALSAPLRFKQRDGVTKWALRQVLYERVPRELIERPKMGFGVPLHEWLRGPLREWAEELLDARRLAREGNLNPEPIRALWEAHLSGRTNAQHRLWGVLMFQSWFERRGAEPFRGVTRPHMR